MDNILRDVKDLREIENRFSCHALLRRIRYADPEYKDPRTISYLSLLSDRSLKLLRVLCGYNLHGKCVTDAKATDAKFLIKVAAGEDLRAFARAAFGITDDDDSIKTLRRYIIMHDAWNKIKEGLAETVHANSDKPPAFTPLIPAEVLSLYREPWLRCGSSLAFVADKAAVDKLRPILADYGFVPDRIDPLETERLRTVTFRSEDDIVLQFYFDVPFKLSGVWGEHLSALFRELLEEGREMTMPEYALLLTTKLHPSNMFQSSACFCDLLDLALVLDASPDLPEHAEFCRGLSEFKLEDTWNTVHSICDRALSSPDASALQDRETEYLSELIGRPYLRAHLIERRSRELMEEDRFLDPPEFTVSEEKGLVYLVNSKVACSSIKATMLEDEVSDDYTVHNITFLQGLTRKELTEEEREYFKFTFVRNPFARLVSCYESKYHVDRDRYKTRFSYRNYLNGYLYNDGGFDEFVRKVCALPYRLMDRHFRSQYDLIFNASGESFDYIGHFETLEEDFSPIQIKYRLRPLPHLNRIGTDDWMNYYTLETADLVYQTFRKDIEVFGYEECYLDLISFIRSQTN